MIKAFFIGCWRAIKFLLCMILIFGPVAFAFTLSSFVWAISIILIWFIVMSGIFLAKEINADMKNAEYQGKRQILREQFKEGKISQAQFCKYREILREQYEKDE